MTPPRFYIPPEYITPPRVTFPRDRYAQIVNVLRLKMGNVVYVFGINGMEYQVRISSLQQPEIQGEIVAVLQPQTEPAIHLQLWVCASRREKMEWIIQKCTEIGTASFRFLVSERSLVQKVPDLLSKTERWQQIAMEAAEQSGRVAIPEVLPALQLKQALLQPANPEQLKLIAWELDRQHSIQQLVQEKPDRKQAILLIGPEGGLSDVEVQLAIQHGFHTVTLGNRIYRLETAAMVGCVLLLDAFHSL